jgi:hypothetical protein
MVNMQMTAEQAKSYAEPSAGDGPRYPYGLCLQLDTDTLKKLGITDLPKVGSTFTLVAKVDVTSVSMHQQQDGDESMCASLQITDMELKGAQRTTDDLAASLYSKG